MAESNNSGQNITRTFTKGLNKDSDPTFVDEGMWTHARNVVNNTEEGNLGTLSNEAIPDIFKFCILFSQFVISLILNLN